MIERRRLLIKE